MQKAFCSPLISFGDSKKTIICCLIAFSISGYGFSLSGSLMPYLIDHHGLSYDIAGAVLSAQSVGMAAAGLLSGALARRIGYKRTFLIGVLIDMLGVLMLLYAPSLGILAASAGVGFGNGTLNNISTSLVNDCTKGSTGSISMLHSLFSFGSFLAPFSVWLFIKTGVNWQAAIWVFMAGGGAMAAAGAFLPKNSGVPPVRGVTAESGSVYAFLKDKRYIVLAAQLFMCVAFQNGITGWLLTYFVKAGRLSEADSQNMLWVVWIAIMAGRAAASMLAGKVRPENFMLIGGAGSAAVLVVCIACSKLPVVAVMLLFFVLGLLVSFHYPITVANASRIIMGNASASGFMTACGSVGGVLATYACGLIAEIIGLDSSLYILYLNGVLLTAVTVLNKYMEQAEKAKLAAGGPMN